MPGDVETKQGNGRWSAARGIQPDPLQTRDGKRASDNPSSPDAAPSYYDISMLKPPVWTPEVGIYFFLGGLSAGAFTLARLAERFGGDNYRALTRTGTAIAALAALPCSPLLIKDLGDPKRFHHMLRVWKPGSPMNLGSWALTSYTLMSVLAELREWTRARRKDKPLIGVSQSSGYFGWPGDRHFGHPLRHDRGCLYRCPSEHDGCADLVQKPLYRHPV